MSGTAAHKARLRGAGHAIRARLPAAYRRQAAHDIARYADSIATLAPGRVVSGFSTFGDELDTAPLMAALARRAVPLALPVVGRRGAPLIFRRWRPGDATARGPFGIAQPLPEAGRVEPTVFLVPLLMFDRRGFRIGYGGGFYDRTLAAARAERRVLALGLAFAAQEIGSVPAESYDEPVDGVLTERGPVRCTGGLRASALSW